MTSTPDSSLPPAIGVSSTTTIRYVTTRADLIYLNVRAICRNPYLIGLWTLVVGWQCWASMHEPRVSGQSLAFKVVFSAIEFVLYFALLFAITSIVASSLALLRKNKGVLGEHTLTLRDDGLLETTAYNESLHRWTAYHRTVNTRLYLIVYATENTGFIVSKKRPLVAGDLDIFVAELLRRAATLHS